MFKHYFYYLLILQDTDLGSLIDIFDWKSSNFPTTLILREINIGSFQKVKKCRCKNFGVFQL